MLIGFDEAQLKNVFRDVGAPRHAERVTIQRIAVPSDQRLERVALAGQNALDYELISFLISDWCGLLRRLHDNRVTRFPLFGQGRGRAPAGGPWFHGSRHGGGDDERVNEVTTNTERAARSLDPTNPCAIRLSD